METLKEFLEGLRKKYPITILAAIIGGIIGLLFMIFGTRAFWPILGILIGIIIGRTWEKK
jgi:ABC-type amino acid transport system permease subunit